MNNADYHAHPAYSKSQLDLVRQSPAMLQWSRKAPRDESEAAEIGTAFHCLLLEPAEFAARYVVAPKFNLRTNQGKDDAAFFAAENKDRIILPAEDMGMIQAMHDSAMAHPEVAALMALPGESESSIFWTDPHTGLPCRARPDRWARSAGVMMDVKTIDKAEQFHWSVRDYRYDVQDAFYTDGARYSGSPVEVFLFIVVGKHRSMGRHPVRVIQLDDTSRARGRAEYIEDLQTILECERTGIWPGVELMNAPERRYY